MTSHTPTIRNGMNKDDVGRSPSGRAGGPSDLSRCASQPKALIPNAEDGADAEVVMTLRKVAYDVLGGNCAFADDDVMLLGELAKLAIAANLTAGLHGTVLDSLNRKHGRGKYATASGTEARSGETACGLDPKDDGPAPEGRDAHD